MTAQELIKYLEQVPPETPIIYYTEPFGHVEVGDVGIIAADMSKECGGGSIEIDSMDIEDDDAPTITWAACLDITSSCMSNDDSFRLPLPEWAPKKS